MNAEPVNVRIAPDLLSALDAYSASEPEPKPSRPEAIRRILSDWLASHGFLTAKP